MAIVIFIVIVNCSICQHRIIYSRMPICTSCVHECSFAPFVFTAAQPTEAVKMHMPLLSTAAQHCRQTHPEVHSCDACSCCTHLLTAADRSDGITYESKDAGSALSVQADHPVAEHGKEEGRNHSHGHDVEQQHCSVVGWSAVCASIPFPAM